MMDAKLKRLISERGGEELAERLEWLDRQRGSRRRGVADAGPGPDRGAHTDFDVAIAGGGLSLLLAPVLADLGLRVAVFERGTAGTVHREWNASADELHPLWESGLFTREEAEDLVIARYDHGICRWHGGGTWPVREVLDHAVDAGRLLKLTRERTEARGVRLYDGHELVAEGYGDGGVRLRFDLSSGGTREVSARVLVDARGAASPYANADLVCPTVGGVMTGLDEGEGVREVNPKVGDILATTEHVEGGHQHIWEAFPGHPGQTTVYLFYYARAQDVGPGALARLYGRYFETLPRFKTGDATLERPTFGYITGWSRLTAPPAPPHPRCVLFGDVAARHSPLTYCGFGTMLRSFLPAGRRIADVLARGDFAEPTSLYEERPVHAGTGALSLMMSVPPKDPRRAGDINALLDVAFGVLHEMGQDPYAALLKDRMAAPQLVEFLHRSSLKRPQVYTEVTRRLGLKTVGRWGVNLLRETLRSVA